MLKHFQFIFLILLLFHWSKIFSQGTSAQLQQLTVSDGLSNNAVNAVYQDSKGFIWVGTEDGLNRYDGYGFEIFRYRHDAPDGIGGNRITAITEDHNGNIWIGLRDMGLNLFDWSTGTFTRFEPKKESPNSFPEYGVYNILVDTKGVVWIVTDNYLSKFDSESKRFKNYRTPSERFVSNRVLKVPIIQENDTSLLLVNDESLVRFNTLREQFTSIVEIPREVNAPKPIVYDVAQIDSTLLIGTSQGLYQWSAHNRLTEVQQAKHYKSNYVFSNIYENEVCFGTDNDVGLYNVNEKCVVINNLLHDGVVVTSILKDFSGVLWLGTQLNGLFKLPAQSEKFYFYDGIDLLGQGSPGYNVQSLFVENDSIIWLGTNNKGFTVFNYQKGVKVFEGPFNEKWKESNSIHSIIKNSDNRMLFATSTGVYAFNRANHQMEKFNADWSSIFSTQLENTLITTLATDLKDQLWIGTKNGLFKVNGDSIETFLQNKGDFKYSSEEVHTLCLDQYGDLLIGTASGVCYFDTISSTVREITVIDSHCPLRNQMVSMTCDRNDVIWLGTNLGLLKMERINRDSATVSIVPGLNYEMITSVLSDRNGRVWVTSSRGVSMLIADGAIRRFDEYDGLPGQIFNYGSISNAPTGEMFFGSVSGLSWVNPDSIQYNPHAPAIVLSSATICYKGDNCFELGAGVIESLSMKYRPGMLLQISFAALDFNQPTKNNFQIYLEGYDENWRVPSPQNIISIPNLLPGQYTLKIRASNNDFIWSDQILEIPIEISAPLWLSKFAYVFYLLILVFFIQLLVNYRIRHYRIANRTLADKNHNKLKIEEQQIRLTRIHRNLTDSINYAHRIQTAMMPSMETIQELVPKSFIYFRPKDSVSGDFYWVHQHKNYTFIAIVDCTGHGVPGGFMSIIGIDLLKSAIIAKGETAPEKILGIMSKELEFTLHNEPDSAIKNGELLQDAMDISLCVIDNKKDEMRFAGAIHDMYLIRNNELMIFKGDRAVIGRRIDGKLPQFTAHTIPLEEDDVVYLFSDGFADQFGGADSKKFMYRKFRHLLLNLHHLKMEEQKEMIHAKFEEWRGNEEQVDDILIMGFKPLG